VQTQCQKTYSMPVMKSRQRYVHQPQSHAFPLHCGQYSSFKACELPIFYVESAKMCTNQKRSWPCPNTHEHRPAFCQRICMNHRCKERFFMFFVFLFSSRFYVFQRFLFWRERFFHLLFEPQETVSVYWSEDVKLHTVIHKNVAVCFWS